MLDAVLTTNSLVFRFLGHRYPDKGLDKLATIGADLELICFFLAMRVKAGNKVGAAALDVSGFLGETASALATTWLDDGLRREVGEFHKKALQAVNSGSGNAAQCLEDGVRLQKAIYDHVRTSAGH